MSLRWSSYVAPKPTPKGRGAQKRRTAVFGVKPNSIALQADYVTVVEDRPLMSVKYCLPVAVFHFWQNLTPAARSLCDRWASCLHEVVFDIVGIRSFRWTYLRVRYSLSGHIDLGQDGSSSVEAAGSQLDMHRDVVPLPAHFRRNATTS